MLPVLAALNLLVRVADPAARARRSQRARAARARCDVAGAGADIAAVRASRVLAEAPYLRNLAALVLLGTIGAALVDYVFKAQAVETFGRGDAPAALLRRLLRRRRACSRSSCRRRRAALALEKLGLARHGRHAVARAARRRHRRPARARASRARCVARGGESVFRGSLFRSGYELFYTPIPARGEARGQVDHRRRLRSPRRRASAAASSGWCCCSRRRAQYAAILVVDRRLLGAGARRRQPPEPRLHPDARAQPARTAPSSSTCRTSRT